MGLITLLLWVLVGMGVVTVAWPLITLSAMVHPEIRKDPWLLPVVACVLVLIWPIVLKDLIDSDHWF